MTESKEGVWMAAIGEALASDDRRELAPDGFRRMEAVA